MCLLPSRLNFSCFYRKETGPRPNPLNSQINFQEIDVGSGWEAVSHCSLLRSKPGGNATHEAPQEAQGPLSTLNATAKGR